MDGAGNGVRVTVARKRAGVRTTIGIAINIPEPWGGLLTRRRVAAGDAVALHVPAHVTLLGPTEIDSAQLPLVEQHLTAVATAHPAFSIMLRGTGTFRPITDVVFVTLATGIGECEQLASAITQLSALERPVRYPYHPHVTIAQNVPDPQLDAAFADLADFEGAFDVDRFTLFEHSAQGLWHPCQDYPLTG
jgi:2'-5' RNA ligase